jgi:hypothetical protein
MGAMGSKESKVNLSVVAEEILDKFVLNVEP